MNEESTTFGMKDVSGCWRTIYAGQFFDSLVGRLTDNKGEDHLIDEQ